MDRWTNRQTDKLTDEHTLLFDRQRGQSDGGENRQAEKKERWTGRQTNRFTRMTDEQTNRQIDYNGIAEEHINKLTER